MNLRSARFTVAAFCVLSLAGSLSRQSALGQGKDTTISNDDQTAAIDCNKSAVTVSGDDNNVTLKGECTALTVSGDDNTITAMTVNGIVVSGDDNNISVEAVARISATGDDNTITWKKGVAGNPQVSSQGDNNKIRQAVLNTGGDSGDVDRIHGLRNSVNVTGII